MLSTVTSLPTGFVAKDVLSKQASHTLALLLFDYFHHNAWEHGLQSDTGGISMDSST